MTKAHEIARKHLKQNADYQLKFYDTNDSTRFFEESQAVWLYDTSKKVGVCSKLTCKWKGPYIISKKIDHYFLKDLKSKEAKCITLTGCFLIKAEIFRDGTKDQGIDSIP